MPSSLSVDLPSAPPARESLHALDWLNFFLAALMTGFGPFVALYLADRGWTPANIGLALTASGLAGLLTQVPAGELLDKTQMKRTLVGIGTAAVTLVALVFALWPGLAAVFAASMLQGTTGGILGPGVSAISLGLVHQDMLAERLGRNQRFASIGGLAAAALMGVIGYALSTRYIFLATAALEVPVLMALARVRAADIHFGRSCGAPDHNDTHPQRVSRALLFKDRRLLTFGMCLFLFQLANASLLPLVGETIAHTDGRRSSVIISAMIVVPQIIVAVLAPEVGRTAKSWGRRPLLLIAFGIVPVRSLLFAVIDKPAFLVAVQALDGVTGATLGVLTALITADLTKGTGRFNLAQGLIGTLSGIGASLSTSLSGLVVGRWGHPAGFLGVSAVAFLAVAILWLFMPETKPPRG